MPKRYSLYVFILLSALFTSPLIAGPDDINIGDYVKGIENFVEKTSELRNAFILLKYNLASAEDQHDTVSDLSELLESHFGSNSNAVISTMEKVLSKSLGSEDFTLFDITIAIDRVLSAYQISIDSNKQYAEAISLEFGDSSNETATIAELASLFPSGKSKYEQPLLMSQAKNNETKNCIGYVNGEPMKLVYQSAAWLGLSAITVAGIILLGPEKTLPMLVGMFGAMALKEDLKILISWKDTFFKYCRS